ncbi:ATP-binding protein [Lysinibacillus louembei]|uniref:histidine kinase n=1 Tax=Lysinibacillus louembei TaxID=1470088 RepID=A0ABZ0RTQ9_9BACI|nr:ATP-binding protein [Lysinibacillus louembei]WPK10358.1 ATP-binding protein [Lysinibacillus louembei]
MPNESTILKKSIRKQFLHTFLLLTSIFLLFILVFYFLTNARNQALEEQQEAMMEKVIIIDGLSDIFHDIFFRARGYYSFKNEQELQLLYEDLDFLDEQLRKYGNMELSADERALYDELNEFAANYRANILPTAISYVQADDYESLRNLSNSGANDVVNRLVSYTKSYKVQTNEELNNLFRKTIHRVENIALFSFLLSIGIILLIGFITHRVTKKLISPIEQLTAATNAFAEGRPFAVKKLEKMNDELGVLANAFINMTKSIQDKEEELTTQNEELLMQQDELQENQLQLQRSLNQLEKYNQLNHALTFTLNKQQLVENLHNYLNDVYRFDASILMWLEGDVQDAKGLAASYAAERMHSLDANKLTRLEEEKSFIIKREVDELARGIAQTPYYAYDMYASIVNAQGKLVAVLMATREGHNFAEDEQNELNGLLKRVSIAFDRILMYEEVERSRQLSKNIIETINEGLHLVSSEGDTLLINHAFEQIMIMPQTEQPFMKKVWLQNFELLCKEPRPLLEFFEKAIAESFEDKRTLRYALAFEQDTFVEVYATCLFEGNQKIGTIFVHRDITKEYEIDKMKSELVSTVSHELRTPLSSILGFTELLLTKTLKPERQQKYVETIHKEAQRLTNLINDFLDLQRMESGRQQYVMKPLQVNEIAMDVINRFQHEKNHHIHLIDKARNVIVKADEERLIQVFLNIVSNAIKFSPNGGDVAILLENKEQMLQVAIKDEGIGIATADLSDLFQKFKRIDNSARRKIGGTGLGLAICREIISMHNGDIWIESVEGKGATVYFTLPLDNELSILEEPSHFSTSQGANVMIVEDDASLALLLSEELKSKGFTVVYHNNVQRAYEEALTTPFIGIVVDLMLSDEMSGWELIQQLKETEQTSKIPIVISSALDEVEELVEKYGVAKYLTKPYSLEEISKALVPFLMSQENKGDILFPQED